MSEGKVGRPRKGAGSNIQRVPPSARQIEELAKRMEEAGEKPEATEEGFRTWLKLNCERELWFLARWILDNDWLGLGDFHRQKVCTFLTDFSSSRQKLLKLPMGHLKTTCASRSMPIHVLIQPARMNRYFRGKLGANCRIMLANEVQQKSQENLAYIRAHLENNEWLYWCWPDVFWENPKSQAARWSDQFLEVKRTEVWAEPSITAIGVNTGFVGRYYDIMIPDDLAALAASQSPKVLERAKKFRRAMRTRLTDKVNGIIIGVGTEWPAVDFYQEWEKDPSVEVLIHSILEEHPTSKELVSLWPEKYPLEVIEKMRQDHDALEWAAWFMNKPVGRGTTALDWALLREFEWSEDGKFIVFGESSADDEIVARKHRISRNMGFGLGVSQYNPMNAKPRLKAPRGMDSEYFEHMKAKYPDRVQNADGSDR